jgi:hypothetical protein
MRAVQRTPAPLIWRSMPDMNPSFRKFAEGLRERVEG